jgi:hypothetical protein
MNQNRKFVILDTTAVTESMVSDCLETSLQTIRKSVNGTKTFLKWDENEPAWVSTMGLTVLTHSEMLEILKTEVWSHPVPPQEDPPPE